MFVTIVLSRPIATDFDDAFSPARGPLADQAAPTYVHERARAPSLFSAGDGDLLRAPFGRQQIRVEKNKNSAARLGRGRGVVARDPHTYYDVVVVVALQARHRRPVHCTMLLLRPHLVFPRPGIPESDAAAGSAGTGIGRCHRAPLVWAALAQASLYRSAVQLKQTHQPDYRYHIISYHRVLTGTAGSKSKVIAMHGPGPGNSSREITLCVAFACVEDQRVETREIEAPK